MSTQITTAFTKQFGSTVFHLSQQKGSRLRAAVRNEIQKGEEAFYDRLGPATAIRRTGRHQSTPQIDSAHSRRRVTLVDYLWADLIDDVDRLRMLLDPAGPYAQSAMMAMGRAMDDEIIAAALGTAYAGQEGDTSTTLGAGQYIGAVSGGGLSGLNVDTLRKTKKILDAGEVDDSIPRYICCGSTQIQNLLAETEVASSDYNTVKALALGQIDSFMGFKFIRSERLASSGAFTINTSTGAVTLSTGNGDASRQCFAWAEDGLLLSVGMDMKVRVSERADKNYSTQVFAEMSLGATRMEEAKVVGILCAE